MALCFLTRGCVHSGSGLSSESSLMVLGLDKFMGSDLVIDQVRQPRAERSYPVSLAHLACCVSTAW